MKPYQTPVRMSVGAEPARSSRQVGVCEMKGQTPARMSVSAEPARSSAALTSAIKVLVRVRPLTLGAVDAIDHNLREEVPRYMQRETSCVSVEDDGQVLVTLPRTLRNTRGDDAHSFRFDDVARQDASQEQVFDRVGKEAVLSFVDGFNAAIFAYGQTGSGKTYTMCGDIDDEQRRGLIPRSLEFTFAELEAKSREGCSVKLQVTLIEIYNEQIIDLLDGEARALQLRENALTGNVYVEGAKVVTVHTVEDTLKLVDTGARRRTVAATGCNDTSSRSHCLLTLHLELEETVGGAQVLRTSCLNLVDLAGSERQQKAKSQGQRLKEANNINRSLSVLGTVILHLAEGYKHVPYRDSKLTFLLRNSIGGNSKTFFVANISAEAAAHSETVSTLKFASFASKTSLVLTRNQVSKSPNIEELKREVRRLHALIDSGREALLLPDDPAGSTSCLRRPAGQISADGEGMHGPEGSADSSARGHAVSGSGGSEREGEDEREDQVTIKRLQVLLWQACEREEKLREKLARERGGFRSRLEEYERVCSALSNALDIARRHMRAGTTGGEAQELSACEAYDLNGVHRGSGDWNVVCLGVVERGMWCA